MGNKTQTSAANSGFTLLEVMIAMAILAMSMTSLLGSQVASLRATRYAQTITSMAFLADYILLDIEWRIVKDGGWQTQDKIYEGDFSEQGWPDVSYKCLIDFIEIPDFSQVQQAKDDSERQANDGSLDEVKDAGDTAFSSLSIVWPMVKAVIESSLRKVTCTVIRTQKNSENAEEYTLSTYWADPEKLQEQAAAFGGEVTQDEDTSPTNPSGSGSGTPPSGGGGGQRPGGQQGGGRGNGAGVNLSPGGTKP